jgi:hypothetical protein
MEKNKQLTQSHWNHIIATFIYILLVLFINDGHKYNRDVKIMIVYFGVTLNLMVLVFNNIKKL